MLKINILCAFLLFVVELEKADAAVAVLLPQDKPAKYANLEGCFVPELDKVLPHNEPYSPKDGKRCVQYTCKENGNTVIFTCGVVRAGDGCKVVPGNLFLAYPDCCPGIECDSKKTTTTPIPV